MKKITLALLGSALSLAGYGQQTAYIDLGDRSQTTISRHIYGQFAEHLGRSIYDGFYRNGQIRMDIVEALKRIKVANLRWPGGCFADKYHWRDGIGPLAQRPLRINTTWGMAKEDNSFGTDEFLKLCNLIGCEPYLAGNMGTGSPREMEEWLEYLNAEEPSELTRLRAANGHPAPYRVTFWGVGNESWGCGGAMTPEYYSNLYKQYANFCDDYPQAQLRKIASGPFNFDYNWTEVFMKQVPANSVWGLSVHYYTIPNNWNDKGSATSFNQQEYFNTLQKALRMEEIIRTNDGIMSRYDPDKKVALVVDEWGVWANPEPGTPPAFLYQQNSLRDALVAASTLNIFNNHADRVRMANLAQSVNVLQSLILTKGDSLVLTPTYHVFDLYKSHQDAHLLAINISSPEYTENGQHIPAVNASASEDNDGIKHLTLVNLDPSKSNKVIIRLPFPEHAQFLAGQLLTGSTVTTINTFAKPKAIGLQNFNEVHRVKEGIELTLPPVSVVAIDLKDPADQLSRQLADDQAEHAAFLKIMDELEPAAVNKKQWDALIKAVDAYYAKGWTQIIPAKLNNIAWELADGAVNKNQLEAALRWSKLTLDQEPGVGSNLDTYAHILYKMGRRAEAISWEEKAVKLSPDDADIAANLAKMKKGQ